VASPPAGPHPPGLKAPANRRLQKHIHTSANREKRDSNTKYTYNITIATGEKEKSPTAALINANIYLHSFSPFALMSNELMSAIILFKPSVYVLDTLPLRQKVLSLIAASI
uniref:Uncharacterized protein n=1 Tax=Neolamprologus brichardi TaxID=32507 RepID=A0A3Q4HJQ7_NEOBR